MGKCYCDYCDVFLTNDSVAVRKQHNEGNRHKYNVCEYYRQYVGQQLQQQIDDIVAQFELDVARGMLRPTYGLPPPSKTTTEANSTTDGPSVDAQSPDSRSNDANADPNSNPKIEEEPQVKQDSERNHWEDPGKSVDAADTQVDDTKSTKDKDVPALHDPVSVNITTEAGEPETSTVPTGVETSAHESNS